MFSCNNDDHSSSTEITPEMKKKAATIRQKVAEYIVAVNSRNIDGVVKQWSDRAVYKDPMTGQLVNGKEGIRNEFKKLFEEYKGAQVSIDIKTIRFPVDEKAVEEGIITLTMPDQEAVKSNNKMIFINENGDWKILHANQLGFRFKGR